MKMKTPGKFIWATLATMLGFSAALLTVVGIYSITKWGMWPRTFLVFAPWVFMAAFLFRAFISFVDWMEQREENRRLPKPREESP